MEGIKTIIDPKDIYSIGIEESIIGAMLNAGECSLMAIEKKIKSNMFYDARHRNIFNAIKKFIEEFPITLNGFDYISFIDTNKHSLDKFGGLSYVAALHDSSATTYGFEEWLKKLVEYNQKRGLLRVCNYVPSNIAKEVNELKEYVQKETLALYEGNEEDEIDHFANVIEEQDKVQRGEVSGIRTGIRCLDNNLGGLHKTEIVTLFARSGVGKTTLAVQIALNMLSKNRILYVSNEMTPKEVYDKMFASKYKVDLTRIRKGQLTDREFVDYSNFIGSLGSDKRLKVIAEYNINTLVSKIRLQKLRTGLDVVFVDYINLVLEGAEGTQESYQLGDVIAKLKRLAMEENLCIVVLAQAKRDTDKKNDTKEMYEKLESSDIQDSARIEQFSNVVLSFYRNVKFDNKMARENLADQGEVDYNSKNPDRNPDAASITINKARSGNKSTMAVRWEGQYSRISNYEI